MRFTTRRPPAILAPYVDVLWRFEGEFAHARERILPHPTMQLIVNLDEDEMRWYDGPGYARTHRLSGAVVCGLFSRHFAIDTAEQRAVCGASFKPGAAGAFLAPPADEFHDAHVDLDDVWGRAQLRARLLEAPRGDVLATLEQILIERLRARDPDPAIEFAVRALDGGAQVGAVTDRLGMSPARFIRRFAAAVGLTPKRYARVRRFGRVLRSVEAGRAVDWTRVAQDCGYYDQAHLIHEFRDFSGVCPTRYSPRSPGDPHHVILD